MGSLNRILAAMAMAVACLFAFGSPAQAYPDPAPTIEIDPEACAGDPVPYWAEASVSGDWTVTYKGETATGTGTRVEGTFPSVKSDAGVANRFTATVVTSGGQTLSASTDVVLTACGTSTVDPGDDGSLPKTGSSLTWWWVVLGVALIAVGDAVVRSRRRSRR